LSQRGDTVGCVASLFRQIIDDPIKSERSDDKVKSLSCKACKYEGMRRTYWYAAMIYPVKYRYLRSQIFS
jgi:hypothetical protein